jgi:hypothetical protein
MNHWMWPVSLVGILSTAVVCGADMFFLTIGRPVLRLASPSAGTEVMVRPAEIPLGGKRFYVGLACAEGYFGIRLLDWPVVRVIADLERSYVAREGDERTRNP